MFNNQEQRRPGLPCPECNFFIEMSIQNILFQPSFTCPSCLLEIRVDRAKSQDAIDLLQQVNVAMAKVKKNSKFNL